MRWFALLLLLAGCGSSEQFTKDTGPACAAAAAENTFPLNVLVWIEGL